MLALEGSLLRETCQSDKALKTCHDKLQLEIIHLASCACVER